MTAPLAFIDCETTGLDPDRHEVWEVAVILREAPRPNDAERVVDWKRETRHAWQLPVDLSRADPFALEIGHFHERHLLQGYDSPGTITSLDTGSHFVNGVQIIDSTTLRRFCRDFAKLTKGAHLTGNVVSFDAERMAKLLKRHGEVPSWHYHLIDTEALAVGWIMGKYGTADEAERQAVELPWDSEKVSGAIGLDVTKYERHTAMGDAEWARDMYDAVIDHTFAPPVG